LRAEEMSVASQLIDTRFERVSSSQRAVIEQHEECSAGEVRGGSSRPEFTLQISRGLKYGSYLFLTKIVSVQEISTFHSAYIRRSAQNATLPPSARYNFIPHRLPEKLRISRIESENLLIVEKNGKIKLPVCGICE
jgi:hypothetical protein